MDRRPLTDLEKVLLVNGGMGHSLLRYPARIVKPPKRYGRPRTQTFAGVEDKPKPSRSRRGRSEE